MEKLCEVSNPELVLKQLKKYYGDDVDLYLSTSKNKKLMKRVKKYILEVSFTRIIRNIRTNKEGIILGIETEDGKMPISIHQHIYHIIYCGD